MGTVRRRRGDFVRATSSVLSDLDADTTLSTAAGARLCSIAAATCGARRGGLFALVDAGGSAARVICLAESGGADGTGDALADHIPMELLSRALAHGGASARGDLLAVAIDIPQAPGDDMATRRFLVLQANSASGESRQRTQPFTEVDRRRLRVLATLVGLKESARRSTAATEVLGRVTRTLAQEGNADAKLQHLAGFLAEVTHSRHALIWSKAPRADAEMRLRAVFGVSEDEVGAVYERSAVNQALQSDLARMALLEHPTAVATSAIPWLGEILQQRGGDLGDEAIVTPIRRRKEVVGVAICSNPMVTAGSVAEVAAREKRALLNALADQIALTAQYVRTALTAQHSARRFALLAAIGEVSLAKMGMGEMLDAILTRVQDHFDSASVSLFLLGSDRSSVRTRSIRRKTGPSTGPWADARLPLMYEEKTLGTIHVRRSPEHPFGDEEYETLAQVAEQIALALATAGRYQVQASMAVLDALTGLPNRRSGDEAIERELERADREGTMFSIALLDVDYFKSINDTHGHDCGDRVLREVGNMFKAQLRATDLIARYGGEEFLIVLPGGDGASARRICERLRHAVSQVGVKDAYDAAIAVTASLGGATYPHDGATRDDLFARADAALYAAKEAGRNALRWAGME